MSLTKSKWILKDTNTLQDQAVTGALEVKLESGQGLTATAAGMKIAAGEVTNDMLAGSIVLAKLSDQARFVLNDTAATITGLYNFTTVPTINGEDIATENYVDLALSGLDFQPDVLAKQIDNTLDPTLTPGARYIITDIAELHLNFGTIAGVGNNDIVEYDGADFVVNYDVSVEGEGALVWNRDLDIFERYDGTDWSEFGGLTGITAGAGLDKTGNTIFTGAGNGITANANDIEVKPDATGGANLAKAIDVNANGVAVKVDDSTIEEGVSGQLRVKADSIGANELDETADLALTGAVTVADQTADDNSGNAANTKYVDAAVAGLSTENKKVEMHKILQADVDAGFFTLLSTPDSALTVSLTPVHGPQQVNKQLVGSTGVTPDFDVLNTNQLHINNTGVATGLTEVLVLDDVVIIEYTL